MECIRASCLWQWVLTATGAAPPAHFIRTFVLFDFGSLSICLEVVKQCATGTTNLAVAVAFTYFHYSTLGGNICDYDIVQRNSSLPFLISIPRRVLDAILLTAAMFILITLTVSLPIQYVLCSILRSLHNFVIKISSLRRSCIVYTS